MWCFTAGSNDGRTPLSRTRFGSFVRIISMHDGVQSSLKKWVGSLIIWQRFRFVKSSSSLVPSALVSPSGHHSWVCPFTSPVKKTVGAGFLSLSVHTNFQNQWEIFWNLRSLICFPGSCKRLWRRFFSVQNLIHKQDTRRTKDHHELSTGDFACKIFLLLHFSVFLDDLMVDKGSRAKYFQGPECRHLDLFHKGK